jgi:hypothetical protein
MNLFGFGKPKVAVQVSGNVIIVRLPGTSFTERWSPRTSVEPTYTVTSRCQCSCPKRGKLRMLRRESYVG